DPETGRRARRSRSLRPSPLRRTRPRTRLPYTTLFRSDRDAGNGGPEVADDLRDGDLLVVAGNDRRDSDRFRIHTLSHRRAPVGPGAQICRCHWSTPRIWTAGYGTGNSNAPSPEHAPTTRTRGPTAVAADRTR